MEIQYKTKRKTNKFGETVHEYRGFDIEVNTSIRSGYWGRYSFFSKTRQKFCKLDHAKKAIDAMLAD